jgi:hypothetical protein
MSKIIAFPNDVIFKLVKQLPQDEATMCCYIKSGCYDINKLISILSIELSVQLTLLEFEKQHAVVHIVSLHSFRLIHDQSNVWRSILGFVLSNSVIGMPSPILNEHCQWEIIGYYPLCFMDDNKFIVSSLEEFKQFGKDYPFIKFKLIDTFEIIEKIVSGCDKISLKNYLM